MPVADRRSRALYRRTAYGEVGVYGGSTGVSSATRTPGGPRLPVPVIVTKKYPFAKRPPTPLLVLPSFASTKSELPSGFSGKTICISFLNSPPQLASGNAQNTNAWGDSAL